MFIPINAHSAKFHAKPLPLPTPSQIIKKVQFDKTCFGVTHDPHFSSHVPGTINVISSTTCPGRRVSVETDLFLGDLASSPKFLTRGFTSKKTTAELSTNWKCIKDSKYLITAVSYHVDDALHGAITVNRALVFCGKAVNSILRQKAKK